KKQAERSGNAVSVTLPANPAITGNCELPHVHLCFLASARFGLSVARRWLFLPFLTLLANDLRKDPTMTFRHCVAVDLGASSGRVMLATWDCDLHTLTLREMHRFANCLQKQDGFVTWD